MNVNGKYYETVWLDGHKVFMIDQNLLPFDFKIHICHTYKETCHAIKTMIVRGAGAIGASAGFAMAQATMETDSANYLDYIQIARKDIEATRPTARNLFFAVEHVYQAALDGKEAAIKAALEIAIKDKTDSRKIGEFGSHLIMEGSQIETHCNAGWLAFVDHGTALSPIYEAKKSGKDIFVYVDETRPRGQGARLTAWELMNENIPNAIIPDNAGAHLMSKGQIDLVIVGADRIALNGDTANKIGTLEKAIAAKYYGVPFYIAAPLSTFDSGCATGKDMIIEERAEEEVLFQTGPDIGGKITEIRVSAPGAKAINPAFDITPSSLITGYITEIGILSPDSTRFKK